MIPDVTLEEPGIDKVGYELAARLVYNLDQLERTSNTRLEQVFLSTSDSKCLLRSVLPPFSACD